MNLLIVPSEQYPNHTLYVQDWVAKDKGIYNRQKQLISIEEESQARIDKNGNPNSGAYRIKFQTGVKEEHWIPKSQSRIVERREVSLGNF